MIYGFTSGAERGPVRSAASVRLSIDFDGRPSLACHASRRPKKRVYGIAFYYLKSRLSSHCAKHFETLEPSGSHLPPVARKHIAYTNIPEPDQGIAGLGLARS